METNSITHPETVREKLIRVWSSRRSGAVTLRVQYRESPNETGCKLLQLQRVSESD